MLHNLERICLLKPPQHLGYDFPKFAFGDSKTRSEVLYLPESMVSRGFISVGHRRSGNTFLGSAFSPFLSDKLVTRRIPSSAASCHPQGGSGVPEYHGSFIATPPSEPAFIALSDLSQYGPELYSKAKPAQPVFDLGNFAYELRDLPGMLKSRYEVNNLKDIGNFHLALNFGWAPLLTDTIKLYNQVQLLDHNVKQLIRDNGRPVHRKFDAEYLSSFEQGEEGVIPTRFPEVTPVLTTGNYISNTSFSQTEWSHSVRTWFSGRFRYFLPDKGSMSDPQFSSLLKRRLFGLYPSPRTVWNAMPWTWLIDYFGNVGDNISNLSVEVADRLINDYAYVMRQDDMWRHKTVKFNVRTPGNGIQGLSCTTSLLRTRKERVAAEPFGFRLKDDLSPFQLGILGALGAKRT